MCLFFSFQVLEETVRIYFCKLTPLRNMERILLGKDMFITQMCNYDWNSSRSEIITVCIKITLYSLLNDPVIVIDDEIQRGFFFKKRLTVCWQMCHQQQQQVRSRVY